MERGETDPNSPDANAGASQGIFCRLLRFHVQLAAQTLIANIQDTRHMLASMNLSKTISVGNSDTFFNKQVLEAADYGVRHLAL